MLLHKNNRFAISRTIAIIVIVIILIAGGAAAYLATSPPSSSTTSSTSTTSSPTTTTSTSTTASTSSTPTAPVYGGTLTAVEEFEPGNIDPAATNTVGGLAISDNVMDTLLTYNWTTNTLVPDLASSWSISNNSLTYTFHLRQGVYFVNPSNNQTLDEFNATDVQYSWNRVLGQSNGYVFGIVGLNMSTFHIIDAYDFNVSLNAPSSAFLSTTADPVNAIIDRSVDLSHGGVVNGTVNSYMASNLVGTGPYMMTQWVKGDHITLVANPHYWGAKPYLNEIVVEYSNDPTTRLLDIKGGTVQVASIDPNLVSSLSGSPNVVVSKIGLTYNVAPVGLNVHKFPTNETLVRLAIEHAINYSYIDNNILFGFGTSYAGPIPKGMFGYNDSISPFVQNLTLAKQEMAQAGLANGNFQNGTAIPPINFVYPFDWPSGALVASEIQSDLAQIGIQVNLESATSVSYAAITALNFTDPQRPQLLAFYWTPDFNDPADYATPSAMYGWSGGYANSTIETLGTEALSTFNQTLRAQLYTNITILTNSAAPEIWTFQSVGYAVYTSNVHGILYDPLIDGYGFEWKTIWLS